MRFPSAYEGAQIVSFSQNLSIRLYDKNNYIVVTRVPKCKIKCRDIDAIINRPCHVQYE